MRASHENSKLGSANHAYPHVSFRGTLMMKARTLRVVAHKTDAWADYRGKSSSGEHYWDVHLIGCKVVQTRPE